MEDIDTDSSTEDYVTCDEDSDSESTSSFSSAVFSAPTPDNPPRVLNDRRFACLSRPQYKTSCGISSLVSVFNFLFSSLGCAPLPFLDSPLTQERALELLGYQAPFHEIRFGKFTGNLMLLKWFRELCEHFEIPANSYIMYKPCGQHRTFGVTSSKALEDLKAGLVSTSTAFIYHCENHYFVPIGFDDTPSHPEQAYSGGPSDVTWILIGEISRKFPPIHCIRWTDIDTDLQCCGQDYLDVRRLERGMQKRKKAASRCRNLHCLMAFERL